MPYIGWDNREYEDLEMDNMRQAALEEQDIGFLLRFKSLGESEKIMRWNVFVQDRATGTRRFLGAVDTQTPGEAIRIAAEFYERDPKDLVVSTFLPWGSLTCQVWLSLTNLVVEETVVSLRWYSRLVSLWLSWL